MSRSTSTRTSRRARIATAHSLLASVITALCLAIQAPPVHADADPASDVLLTQSVFYPYQPRVSPELEATLNNLLTSTAREHMPLKVAIIGMQIELGAIPEYWGHPQAYAAFLDREISDPPKREPLLVVMPDGFGLVGVAPASALARVPIDAGERTYGLTRAAILAVEALADANGHPVATPKLPAAPGTGGELPTGAIAGVVGLVALGLALTTLRLRARRRLRRRAAAGRGAQGGGTAGATGPR